MPLGSRSRLAVLLHADVVGSTALVRKDERLAHDRIQKIFRTFGDLVRRYGGTTREIRGDALVAEFSRPSDAVLAALAAQNENVERNTALGDEIVPEIRIGIALGEVVVADQTVTGAGIVMAQRLEQLANPGGICISGAIREALPDRLPIQYESLGDQQIKGFDEPVRAFSVALTPGGEIPAPEPQGSARATISSARHVSLGAVVSVALLAAIGGAAWWKPWQIFSDPEAETASALTPSASPSIAVLPFTNLSGEEEQDYFSDGITQDIITDLSRLSNLTVIARQSSFTYRGTPLRVQKIGEELGVRYLLEGSVRKSGRRVRVSAQLVDATDGSHLWANRYDRELSDVFAVQDAIKQKIVDALSLRLTGEENKSLKDRPTVSFEAYDLFLQGQRHFGSQTKEGFEAAAAAYRRAIEIDPKFARAYGALATTLTRMVQIGQTDAPAAMNDRALELARYAVSIDPALPQTQWALGFVHLQRKEPNEARSAAERAVALSPSYADGYLLLALIENNLGHGERALRWATKAMELNPYPSWDYPYNLGRAQYLLGKYEKAVEALREALSRNEGNYLPRVWLAASLVQLGRQDEAEWEVAEIEVRAPGLTAANIVGGSMLGRGNPTQRLLKDLLAAGMRN